MASVTFSAECSVWVKGLPDWQIALWNSPFASGDPSRWHTLLPPEPPPNTVTLSGDGHHAHPGESCMDES